MGSENTDMRVTGRCHSVPGTPTSNAPQGHGPDCWDSCLYPSSPALPASVSPPMTQDSGSREWEGVGGVGEGDRLPCKRRPGADVSPAHPGCLEREWPGPHSRRPGAQAGTGHASKADPSVPPYHTPTWFSYAVLRARPVQAPAVPPPSPAGRTPPHPQTVLPHPPSRAQPPLTLSGTEAGCQGWGVG